MMLSGFRTLHATRQHHHAARPDIPCQLLRPRSTRPCAAGSSEPSPHTPQSQPSSPLQPGAPVAEAAAMTQQPIESAMTAAQAEVVEATSVLEPGISDIQGLPRLPDSVTQQAVSLYTAVAATQLAQGIGLAAVAWVGPGLLLPAAAASAPAVLGLAALLQGCAGAVSVMAAGLALHLRGTAQAGELATWRHQRINAALTLFGLLSLISTAWSATAASPIFTGVSLVASLGTAAACALVARTSWAQGPWLCWSVAPGNLQQTWQLLSGFLTRDFNTLAGALCLLWLFVTVVHAPGILLDPVSWGRDAGLPLSMGLSGAHPLYPYATPASVAPALDVLRRACAAGLLLSGVLAHTLLEAAANVKTFNVLPYVKTKLVQSLGQNPQQQLVQPPSSRFLVLQLTSVVGGCGLLALFLAKAVLLDVDVNRDAALMGPLFWTTLMSTVYLVMTIFTIDWHWLSSLADRVVAFFVGLVAWVTQTFVLKLDWMFQHKM